MLMSFLAVFVRSLGMFLRFFVAPLLVMMRRLPMMMRGAFMMRCGSRVMLAR